MPLFIPNTFQQVLADEIVALAFSRMLAGSNVSIQFNGDGTITISSSGGGGGGGSASTVNDLSSQIGGGNTTFILPSIPDTTTLMVFYNGLLASTSDYSIVGDTLTTTGFVPAGTDKLVAVYATVSSAATRHDLSSQIGGGNTNFNLGGTPSTSALMVFYNGLMMSSADYSVSGTTLTTTGFTPVLGDTLVAFY